MAPLDGLTLAKFVKQSPALMRLAKPLAGAFANWAGHRKVGLKYDDLIIEENDATQKAITRLTERESYDRAFRLRQAIQQSILHRELPKEKWLKPSEDTRYLTPLIDEIQKEQNERDAWDTVKVKRGGH